MLGRYLRRILEPTRDALAELRREMARQKKEHDAQTQVLLDRMTVLEQRNEEMLATQAALCMQVSFLEPPLREAPPEPHELAPPRVSVILPVWNRRECVSRALDSLQCQTEPRWECLVVDDGSDDGTAEVLDTWLDREPRLHLVTQPHQGAAAARNAGLRLARANVIAYLDSDNLWYPGYLRHVVAAFDHDPLLWCTYAGLKLAESPPAVPPEVPRPFDWAALRGGNYIDLNVFSHRAALVGRLGGFDESLHRLQDWDLILRYTRDHGARPLPVAGCRYYTDAPNRISCLASYEDALRRIEEKFPV